MQRVFVLDNKKKPLAPCIPRRARKLLSNKKAAVFKYYPFTIILKERCGGNTQPLSFKVDPGSKTTGIAIVSHNQNGKKVIWAANLNHRGYKISEALQKRRAIRRSRRSRKTRYRKPKWTNAMSKKQLTHINQRPKGWLAPSIRSRKDNIIHLYKKINKIAPLKTVSIEDVRFDMQKIINPKINGKEYQRGTLFEYEVKEYLLYLYNHNCAYCNGMSNDPVLEKEHIIPKSKGGSNRISNLSLACTTCNQEKGNLLPKEWLQNLKASKKKIDKKRYILFSRVAEGIKPSLKDAAAVNTLRNAISNDFNQLNVEVEKGNGALTKFNRTNQQYSKDHWIDAACVGKSGESIIIPKTLIPLTIKANGRGSRQMCRVDKYGFPRTKPKGKSLCFGFKTGDLVKATIPKGKKKGVYVGRVAVRSSGSFNISNNNGTIQGISYRYCRLLQKNDGYSYSNHIKLDNIKQTKEEDLALSP